MMTNPNNNQPTLTYDEQLLTTADVAAICRAPLSTVRYWRHVGVGPASFRLGRRVVYRREDVQAWIHRSANEDSRMAKILTRSDQH